MPAYTFEALDAQGATQRGVLEADTAKAARVQLRQQALVPIRVEPVASGDSTQTATRGLVLWESRVMGATTLTIWTRQLAGLVASGLPLERALTSLSEEADDPRQRNLVAARRAEVNAGAAFASALSQHPRAAGTICQEWTTGVWTTRAPRPPLNRWVQG